jgi:calcineurin-like phosphoesterase family protein
MPNNPRNFIISDLHLDHANIIKHCERPFENVRDMNSVIISRWNQAVGKHDVVYVVGDFAWFRDTSYRIRELIRELKGVKIFISGNHDKNLKCKIPYLTINYDNESFLLVHTADPEATHNKVTLAHTGICEILNEWKKSSNWIICGHHHNNNPEEHGLINPKTHEFNVSAELLDYTPIEIEKLLFMR